MPGYENVNFRRTFVQREVTQLITGEPSEVGTTSNRGDSGFLQAFAIRSQPKLLKRGVT